MLQGLSFLQHRSASACQAYDELLLKQQTSSGAVAKRGASSSSSSLSPRPAGLGPLPWLYYEAGSDYLTSTDVDLRYALVPAVHSNGLGRLSGCVHMSSWTLLAQSGTSYGQHGFEAASNSLDQCHKQSPHRYVREPPYPNPCCVHISDIPAL